MDLRRSDPAERGIRREPSPGGFVYTGPRGEEISDAGWITDLAIPPAWQEVWICPDRRGHIQATGRDEAGRLQYIYHPQWRQVRDSAKFERALDLAASLGPARSSVTRDLAEEQPTLERALASAFRLIDTLAIRIGSEAYLDAHGTRGICTLQCRHVALDGTRVALRFPAKSGISWQSEARDRDLARVLGEVCERRGPRARLLCWHTSTDPGHQGRGRWRVLTPELVNADIHERTGGDFTAKDLRTLHGTAQALRFLSLTAPSTSLPERRRQVSAAVKHVAGLLGNTPGVARNSYIDPRVIDRYLHGEVFPRSSRTPESALHHLLR